MAEREASTHQPVDENTEQAQSEDYSDRHIGRNEPCPCGSGKKYRSIVTAVKPDMLS